MSSPDPLTPLAHIAASLNGGNPRLTAAGFVQKTLRRAILSGELAGGTRLGLADIAEILEVSTTPVREALRQLATEGLVQFDPYRGGTVQTLTRHDMEEVVKLRSALEPVAVREAVEKITEEDLERASEIHARMAGEDEPWVDLNRQLHFALYASVGSPRLLAMIKSLQDSEMMYVGTSIRNHPAMRDQARRDHAELIEAMRARDAERAVEITLRHLALPLMHDELDAIPAHS